MACCRSGKSQGYGRSGWGGSSSEVHSGSVTVQTVQTMFPAGALAAQLGPLRPVCLPHFVTTSLLAPITVARASQFLELAVDSSSAELSKAAGGRRNACSCARLFCSAARLLVASLERLPGRTTKRHVSLVPHLTWERRYETQKGAP
jgi:hypothetical protein